MKAEWTNSDSLTTSQTTKAILVIDMPSDCNHCQFADFSNGQWECNQHKGGRIGESMKISSTPSWCPLKSLPKPRSETIGDETPDAEAHGWNLCIEELEK